MTELQNIKVQANNDAGNVKSMSAAEKAIYLAYVNLYYGYRQGIYTAEKAKKIDKLLTEDYKQYCLWEEIYTETASIRNRCSTVLTEAERCGCEYCKKLVRIFDGRYKDGRKETENEVI